MNIHPKTSSEGKRKKSVVTKLGEKRRPLPGRWSEAREVSSPNTTKEDRNKKREGLRNTLQRGAGEGRTLKKPRNRQQWGTDDLFKNGPI